MDINVGWIKIHRKILTWEWYNDTNMVRLFLHLLLCANYEDKRWRGTEVKRGQLITSVSTLAQQTNLTEMQIRTCLNKLSNSGEINKQTTNRNTIITICNYDSYQQSDPTDNEQDNKQITNNLTLKQQTNNKQITNKQQTNNKQITTTKEYKEYNKENKDKELKENKEEKNVCVITHTHASRTSKQSKNFDVWLNDNCPYIAKHYTLPTDSELEKLVNVYGAEMVAEMCQQIENRADLRKRYTNLYRTLLNWLKKEKQSNMTNDEREREKRLASYAKVANEFLNTPIRECETIPFDMER